MSEEEMVIELTEQEFGEVVREITQRIKDMIYMNLERRVRKTLRDLLKANLDINDSITFEWKIEFIFGDIVQIGGRIRRTKKGEVKVVE